MREMPNNIKQGPFLARIYCIKRLNDSKQNRIFSIFSSLCIIGLVKVHGAQILHQQQINHSPQIPANHHRSCVC